MTAKYVMRANVALAALAGLALRIFFVLKLPVTDSGDAPFYIELAWNWLKKGVYGGVVEGQLMPLDTRVPGYPAFLAAIFSVIGIYGAQLVGVQIMGVDSGSFWSQMRAAVGLSDITEGIVKSIAFGIACSLIAVYQGYYATPTAEGVGRATTRTVVTSAVVILFLDYLITAAFL